MELFTIQNLSFSYPEQEKKAIKDLSFSIKKGEFLVLCGPSGCGKSTLLRQLKTVLAPFGKKEGSILYKGCLLETVTERVQASEIGFVQQSVENQLVTDKVWHELAFGLESLGFKNSVIRRRVAETASFFGMESWFYKKVAGLSGGQKQLLNLASVMVMQPQILILDEPTSQLDPIAASEFLSNLGKINRELGITILLTEHRLEEAFALADRVIVLDQGSLLTEDIPSAIGLRLLERKHPMLSAMPAAVRIWAGLNGFNGIGDGLNDFNGIRDGEHTEPFCPVTPVTVGEGKRYLMQYRENHPVYPLPEEEIPAGDGKKVIEAKEVWFRYEKDLPDVVKGLDLTLREGDFLAILGGNGTGKTTSLKLLAESIRPYRGRITVDGKVAMLAQNPQTLFVKKTVREDLFEITGKKGDAPERVNAMLKACALEGLEERHPYDLSGGEQQRAALAKVLLTDPDILFLDEPTKGLDGECKKMMAAILKGLQSRGKTILMVSHDIEFCAENVPKCALFFDGSIIAADRTRPFFAGNHFYTTAANRMTREFLPEAVTVADVLAAFGAKIGTEQAGTKADVERANAKADTADAGKAETTADTKKADLKAGTEQAGTKADAGKTERKQVGGGERNPGKLPLWRKLLSVLAGTGAFLIFLKTMGVTSLSESITASGITDKGKAQLNLCVFFIACLLVMFLSLGSLSKPIELENTRKKGKLPKRTVAASVMILLLAPVTLFAGVFYLSNKQYYITSLLVLIECMLPFFLVFEGRKPKARELVLVAVLCAIGVAGRGAFFMLPQFKPVMALTIISGVALGGETGFLVGAVTMLASNMLFSQGPWTPWQMFSMGIIGYLAGVLFQKGWLRPREDSLCIFGMLSAILIYGGLMNPASALIWGSGYLNGKMLLTYYISGFPMDCIQGAATVIFLLAGARPMLEKLDRVKIKYGLI